MFGTPEENTQDFDELAHTSPGPKKDWKTTFFEKPCLEHRKRTHRTSAVGPPWGALRAFMRNLDGHRTLGLALWSSKGSWGT